MSAAGTSYEPEDGDAYDAAWRDVYAGRETFDPTDWDDDEARERAEDQRLDVNGRGLLP